MRGTAINTNHAAQLGDILAVVIFGVVVYVVVALIDLVRAHHR